MLVGDNLAERNAVLVHELGHEPGGAISGSASAVAASLIVGVLTLLPVREALVDRVAVDGVVPGDVAEGILAALELAPPQAERITVRAIGAKRRLMVLLFDVLHLLADSLEFRFGIHDRLREGGVVGLGADGIELAVDLLAEEIH